ncbi:uncharacterized protein LOC119432468 [Dermacentor silvarum]|uniref:uncharacterized protein LOC119432468 n=1 Tax=Dermacentor silvarum TaxID=543639 RepID=UPI0018976059|nr:uncharacterized protein LOC119432468 [Dermacentor silvarum]
MDTTPNSEVTPNPTVPEPVVATLKLPEFWQSDSELWFLSVEPLFRRHRVTSQTARYDYVIGALPPAVIAILIRRTAESEKRRLQQLLTAEEIGDRKPTELLRRMRHLIGDQSAALDASILRELFLQRLPQQVRMILSVSSTVTLNSLAQMADKTMDVGTPAISGIERQRDSSLFAQVHGDRLDRLLQANEELNRKVDQLAAELSSLKADHRGSASRQRHQSRDR